MSSQERGLPTSKTTITISPKSKPQDYNSQNHNYKDLRLLLKVLQTARLPRNLMKRNSFTPTRVPV